MIDRTLHLDDADATAGRAGRARYHSGAGHGEPHVGGGWRHDIVTGEVVLLGPPKE